MGQRDWDERYLQLAAHFSTWSKDHAKVGAVLVRDNRIVGAGFNGLPSGVQDDFDRLKHKVIKQVMIVHAEENALLVAGDRARGATLYVYGKPVCARCAASIIQAKVAAVVSSTPTEKSATQDELIGRLDSKDGDIDWSAMGELAVRMFGESGVRWRDGALMEYQIKFMKELPGQPTRDRSTGRERRTSLSLAAE